MARKLDIDFSVVGSYSHEFKDKSITSYIINFEPKYFSDIKDFLDENNILWHEVDNQVDKEEYDDC